VDALALPLSYLHHYHPMPENLRVRARPELFVEMNLVAKDATPPREGLRSLPPLLKGYVRAGCCIGDGAVIDRQFNTTDVAVVVKTDLVTDKYYRHYERETSVSGQPALDSAAPEGAAIGTGP
jgi:putative hemolysin